ncbi:MAG: PQQ-binding-like beta-propeller repeat protein [Acidobacteria bacterium]|nr:PQQ-binding-like beta-propeller repeat protein [Acidobacteriota bacterium]
MPRTLFRSTLALVSVALAIVVLAWMAPRLSGQAGSGFPSKENGEWAHYNSDIKGSRYMPLDQINASNFNKLEVAWRFKTDNLGPRPEYKLEGTPLMVKGTLYMTGGTRRAVVALDAKTGEQKWVYAMDEGKRAEMAPRVLSGRGLSYWTDGKGDDRIIYVTIGYRLVQLNARTGQPISTFGKGGMVDLKEGVVYGKLVNGRWQQVQIPLVEGEIGVNSTPLVVGDMVIVQSAMAEGLRYEYTNNAKGLVRAYDVRTGRQIWRFNMMPGPGEFGHETWENGSWNWTGNTGVWTEMSADAEAGIVYLPGESPTIDAYGGNRPGAGLFGETLVALDLKTGKRKWHFQIVHHGLWDYDLAGAPLLMDVTIDGKPRKIVGQTSKEGWLYTFDRITGEPIWPIIEKPVPQSDVPGEKSWPTQPFPTKPPTYSRNYLAKDDVIDFTPELRAKAMENLKKYRWEEMPFVPYVIPSEKWLGTILVGNTMGGVNWEGSSFNPETGIFYTQANNSSISGASLSQEYFDSIKPEKHTPNHIAIWEAPGFGQPGFEAPSTSGYARREAPAGGGRAGGGGGRGANPLTDGLGGLPIIKPPYGVITALDMHDGTMKWQVPHGDTPDAVRNSPLLKGLNIPKTGQNGIVGVCLTKSLVIVGDPQVTSPPGPPDRPRGAMLRAYDQETGKEVGAVWMPSSQSGNPMTYMLDGRQYIIVAVGGGNYSSEYIAFALPQSDIARPTNNQR